MGVRVAVDGARQIAIANPMSMPFVSRLVPRGENNPPAPNGAHPPGSELGVQPMYGTPYGVSLGVFLFPAEDPLPRARPGAISRRSTSRLTKSSGSVASGLFRIWRRSPCPFELGTPMLGGPLVTAGRVWRS